MVLQIHVENWGILECTQKMVYWLLDRHFHVRFLLITSGMHTVTSAILPHLSLSSTLGHKHRRVKQTRITFISSSRCDYKRRNNSLCIIENRNQAGSQRQTIRWLTRTIIRTIIRSRLRNRMCRRRGREARNRRTTMTQRYIVTLNGFSGHRDIMQNYGSNTLSTTIRIWSITLSSIYTSLM